jgi:hypothetical protein
MVDGDPVTIPLNLIMIDDIALANVTGEIFNDIAQKLKKDSFFDRTAMGTLRGCSMAIFRATKHISCRPRWRRTIASNQGVPKQGIVSAFIDLEKQYLPIWKEAP